MVLAKYGENTELDEDASGNTVIRNTATGTEVLLADFVDIVGSFGSAANRIDGESFFDQLNANSVETSTVIDSDDATSYDVGDDLASGAFSDGDNDGTYTLPNPDDGIEVGSVNTDELTLTAAHETILTLGSGATETVAPEPSASRPLVWTVIPNNEPGNAHGYRINSIQWNPSFGGGQGRVGITISETENDGGGEARILAFEITP